MNIKIVTWTLGNVKEHVIARMHAHQSPWSSSINSLTCAAIGVIFPTLISDLQGLMELIFPTLISKRVCVSVVCVCVCVCQSVTLWLHNGSAHSKFRNAVETLLPHPPGLAPPQGLHAAAAFQLCQCLETLSKSKPSYPTHLVLHLLKACTLLLHFSFVNV